MASRHSEQRDTIEAYLSRKVAIVEQAIEAYPNNLSAIVLVAMRDVYDVAHACGASDACEAK